VEGNIAGTMSGAAVTLRSSQRFEGTSLRYLFEGEMKGNQITGTVNLGEYGTARWTATKHQYPDPASGRRAG
jgi:hypothetical protein